MSQIRVDVPTGMETKVDVPPATEPEEVVLERDRARVKSDRLSEFKSTIINRPIGQVTRNEMNNLYDVIESLIS